jgi:hypothetical protein
MTDDIPPSVTKKFGSTDAKPRIVSVYDPRVGWRDGAKDSILTYGTVEELVSAGVTLADVKWKSQHHQISLLRITLPHG